MGVRKIYRPVGVAVGVSVAVGVLNSIVPLNVGLAVGDEVEGGLIKNNQALLNVHTALPELLSPVKPRKPSFKEATLLE